MGRLAVVGGHSILETGWMADAARVDVVTEHGPVALHDDGDVVVLQRHGLDTFTNAANIDHRAHLRALEALGCDRILGLASVGSLRTDLPVGAVVVPDDFIALHLGLSFHTDAGGHQIPGFDPGWRASVVDVWQTHDSVTDGGVYWQTIGPRFETPAEIRLLAVHADVVGMTVASEAVLAGELGIAYAAVCVVDNLANGLEAELLTMDTFHEGAAAVRPDVVAALDAVVPELAR